MSTPTGTREKPVASGSTPEQRARYVVHGPDLDAVLDCESGVIIHCGDCDEAALLRDQLNGYEDRMAAAEARIADLTRERDEALAVGIERGMLRSSADLSAHVAALAECGEALEAAYGLHDGDNANGNDGDGYHQDGHRWRCNQCGRAFNDHADDCGRGATMDSVRACLANPLTVAAMAARKEERK